VADLEAGGYLVKIEDHTYTPGRSERSGVIVEPLPMEQWWVRMEPLAAPAIKVVEDGDIRFVPEMWTKVYFEWMRNIRDWCISRQLWWGHQIPAWHCAVCSGITVARDTPEVCGECGSTDITQDPDVLDTWFSSALWPFSTLGWPEKTPDLAKFYPGHVMETGFDILFFWVARMIFMSLHFMDEIPFDTVFLHAMVRDKDGGKMSKMKGNVVDPLHLKFGIKPGDIDEAERENYSVLFEDFPEGVEPQGCDALRFTLAIYAAQGRDIKLDVKRVSGYRQFLNKLWNASKFVLMHLEDWTPRELDLARERLTPADRWILGRLQAVVEKVTTSLEAFQLNDAAHALYNFVWREFCDWYIELSKPTLYQREDAGDLGGDVDSARTVLFHTLEQTLRLMHPIVPFITEEIWQVLPKPAGAAVSITVAPWPQVDEGLRFSQETADMERAIDLISRVRTIRGETGVKPSVVIEEILLLSDDGDVRGQLERTTPYLRSQARVDRVRIAAMEGTERPAQTATAVVGGVEIHIPLAGLIDVEEETARLERELSKVAKDLEHVGRKLANPRFVENAPDHIVEKERDKQTEILVRKAALEASLSELSQLGA
jgi:valyl-tRNA synthetase